MPTAVGPGQPATAARTPADSDEGPTTSPDSGKGPSNPSSAAPGQAHANPGHPSAGQSGTKTSQNKAKPSKRRSQGGSRGNSGKTPPGLAVRQSADAASAGGGNGARHSVDQAADAADGPSR